MQRPTRYLYGGPEDESFSAKSPEEYIRKAYSEGGDAEPSSFVVATYKRDTASPEWVREAAEMMVRDFVEHFDERFALDNTTGIDSPQDLKVLIATLTGVLQTYIKATAAIQTCERVTTRTYSSEEIKDIIGWRKKGL